MLGGGALKNADWCNSIFVFMACTSAILERAHIGNNSYHGPATIGHTSHDRQDDAEAPRHKVQVKARALGVVLLEGIAADHLAARVF